MKLSCEVIRDWELGRCPWVELIPLDRAARRDVAAPRTVRNSALDGTITGIPVRCEQKDSEGKRSKRMGIWSTVEIRSAVG